MKLKFTKAWFINFSGIGNGIVVAPILRCFEKSQPSLNYYHTENQILEDPWFKNMAGLKNLEGFSPAIWRRFKKENWPAINHFIKENKIDLIINLRNEGPQYDTEYYRFKREVAKQKMGLNFWDLDFKIIQQRKTYQNLTNDILALFKTQNINIATYNSKWLSFIRNNPNEHSIGFGMAASQSNKRWPIFKWIKLASLILGNSNKNIIIIHGKSKEENDQAISVWQAIGQKRCKLINNKSIKDISLQVAGLHCFISNDTGFLHVAAAIDVPAIGLYTSTNPEIWSPNNKANFIAYQNSFMARCPNPKPHCGNCFHYYDICPAIAKYGDDIDPNKIYKIISEFSDKKSTNLNPAIFMKIGLTC